MCIYLLGPERGSYASSFRGQVTTIQVHPSGCICGRRSCVSRTTTELEACWEPELHGLQKATVATPQP